jgi:hypothetical protein
MAIASEVFGGQVSSAIEDDPEIENKRYIVIHVQAQQLTDAAAHRKEWYSLTRKILGRQCDLVLLAITIV